MCDAIPSNETDLEDLSPVERVEELFRLSDFLFGGDAGDESRDPQQIAEAERRLNNMVSKEKIIPQGSEPRVLHSWMLFVLEDLAQYAGTWDLQELERDLLKTRDRLDEHLKRKP